MLPFLKIGIYSLLIISLFSGCTKNNENKNSTAGSKKIIIIGHAGSGFNYLFMPFNPYPPNSFQSLKNGLSNGAEGVEVDVQLTADHQLVLYHDNTLDEKTSLSGFVIDANSMDVLSTPYKCGFPYDLFHDEKIITFNQWIEYAIQLTEIPFLQIDLKTGSGLSEAVKDTLLHLIAEELKNVNYPLDKVIAISGEHAVVTKILKNYPHIKCAFQPGEFSKGLEWVVANGCKFIIIDQKYLAPGDVQSAHDKGIGVIALGGRAKSTFLKLIKMEPDYIQSNNVNLLHRLLQ